VGKVKRHIKQYTNIAMKVALIGNTGQADTPPDGQTLRTRLTVSELGRYLLPADLVSVNSCSLFRNPLSFYLKSRAAIRSSDAVIIMPGQRGLKWLLPTFLRWAKHGKPVHYLVVGGWLPDFLSANPRFTHYLKQLSTIHVQSQRMVRDLTVRGLSNVYYLPNFRRFELASQLPEKTVSSQVFRLAFLSRIIPEKGVAEAIQSVLNVNKEQNRIVATLDLWGPVPAKFQPWFLQQIPQAQTAVNYRGIADVSQVREVLAQYDALLFPTYYPGEGFPGVVLDAFSAGIPVIATRWHDNEEVIEHDVSGLIVSPRSPGELASAIKTLIGDPDKHLRMREAAWERAPAFHIDRVFPPLLQKLGILTSVSGETP
jgi:glycosyltransferase involved in cell wall biosynthesis